MSLVQDVNMQVAHHQTWTRPVGPGYVCPRNHSPRRRRQSLTRPVGPANGLGRSKT